MAFSSILFAQSLVNSQHTNALQMEMFTDQIPVHEILHFPGRLVDRLAHLVNLCKFWGKQ